MQNKKVTYLLLVLVAIIWIGVIFRIVGFVSKNENGYQPKDFAEVSDSTQKNIDTFHLIVNYRDPFLNTYPSTGIRDSFTRKTNVKSNGFEITKSSSVEWPDIQYKGIIQNKNTGKVVMILAINKKDYLFQPGVIQHNIKIEKFTSDSLLVSLMGNKKVVYKNKH